MSWSFILLISSLLLTGIAVFLFARALLGNKTDATALAWASGDEPAKSKSIFINFSRPLVHNFTLQHAVRVKNLDYRKKVEKKLEKAGLLNEINVDEFIGLKILWGLGFPIVLILMNFTMSLGYNNFLLLGFGIFGFFYWDIYATSIAKERYVSVVSDLPFFIDLLALATEAGLDFITAIQRIIDKSGASVLAEELRTALNDIQLGQSRSDALKAMAQRLDISEITSLVAVVNDAEFTGTSITAVLKDQSTQMRLERFVRAEKAGARASQMMLIPMILFILPAVFIVVFAPVVLQFFGG
jgi:tight adherence protein C